MQDISEKIGTTVIGLSISQNIFYLSVFGRDSSLVSLAGLLNVGVMMMFLIHNSKKNVSFFSFLPISLKIFFVSILLSIIPVLLFNRDLVSIWLKGIIALLLSYSIILNINFYRDHIEYILEGLYYGFLINTTLSLLIWWLNSVGIGFSVSNLINNLPVYDQSLRNLTVVGLFREPGHYARWLCIVFPTLYFYKSNRRLLISLLFIGNVTLLVSASVLFCYIDLVICLAYSLRQKNLMSKIVFVVAFAGLFILVKNRIGVFMVNSIISTINDFSISGAASNQYRFDRMLNGVEIIRRYSIIGCGYNMQSVISQRMFGRDYFGIYSEIVGLTAELGIGVMPYLVFLFSQIKKRRQKNDLRFGIAFTFCFILIEQLLTDLFLDEFVFFFIGISVASKDRLDFE